MESLEEENIFIAESCLGFLLLKFLVLQIQWTKSQQVCTHNVKYVLKGPCAGQVNTKSTRKQFLREVFSKNYFRSAKK